MYNFIFNYSTTVYFIESVFSNVLMHCRRNDTMKERWYKVGTKRKRWQENKPHLSPASLTWLHRSLFLVSLSIRTYAKEKMRTERNSTASFNQSKLWENNNIAVELIVCFERRKKQDKLCLPRRVWDRNDFLIRYYKKKSYNHASQKSKCIANNRDIALEIFDRDDAEISAGTVGVITSVKQAQNTPVIIAMPAPSSNVNIVGKC